MEVNILSISLLLQGNNIVGPGGHGGNGGVVNFSLHSEDMDTLMLLKEVPLVRAGFGGPGGAGGAGGLGGPGGN